MPEQFNRLADVKIPVPDAQFPVLVDGAFYGHTWRAGRRLWYAKPLRGKIDGPFADAPHAVAAVLTTPGVVPVPAVPGFIPTAGAAPADALCSLHRGPVGPGMAWVTDPGGWWVCVGCLVHVAACADDNCDHHGQAFTLTARQAEMVELWNAAGRALKDQRDQDHDHG